MGGRLGAPCRYVAKTRPAQWFARQRVVLFIGRALQFFGSFFLVRAWRFVRRAIHRGRQWLGRKEVWYWLLAWIGCGFMAWGILDYHPRRVVTSVVAVVLLALIARRLYIGVIASMLVAASFLHIAVIPKPITLGGQGLNAAELLIVFMLAVVLVRSLVERRFEFLRSPITLPLLLLSLAIMVSVGAAYAKYLESPKGVFPFTLYNDARPMFYYSLFFVVAFGIRTRQELRILVAALIIIAAAVAVLMIVQYALGHEQRVFMGTRWAAPRVEELGPDEEGVTRSLPPGLALMYVLFPAVTCLACMGKGRSSRLLGLASVLIAIGLLLSFTRMYWLSVSAAMVVIWMLVDSSMKRRLLTFGTVALTASVLLTIAFSTFAPGAARARFSHALYDRLASTVTRSTVYSPGLQNRIQENRSALELIKRNVIFGVGLGTPLHRTQVIRPGYNTQVIVPIYRIHNSYLDLWARFGLLGVLSFVWLSVAFLARSLLLFFHAQEPVHKVLGLTFFAAQIQFMMHATVGMSVPQIFNATTIALCWGLVEVMWRLEKGRAAPSPGDVVPMKAAHGRLMATDASAMPRQSHFPSLGYNR